MDIEHFAQLRTILRSLIKMKILHWKELFGIEVTKEFFECWGFVLQSPFDSPTPNPHVSWHKGYQHHLSCNTTRQLLSTMHTTGFCLKANTTASHFKFFDWRQWLRGRGCVVHPRLILWDQIWWKNKKWKNEKMKKLHDQRVTQGNHSNAFAIQNWAFALQIFGVTKCSGVIFSQRNQPI